MKKINLPKMAFFIPEWDDMIFDKYDYVNDCALPKAKKVYSHQIYDKPNYDGILASKVKLEENKSKMKKLNEMGVHEFYKFEGPIFGDCGAWGYVNEKDPPYKTKEILEYYQNLGFDIGVSIDHIVKNHESGEKLRRQQLSMKNAEEFIDLYNRLGYDFIPATAIQGWNIDSYLESFNHAIELDYNFIAIGGIASESTEFILSLLKSLQDPIQKVNKKGEGKINLHLFGVSRLREMRKFLNLGVTSFDSSSELRKAWLSSSENYFSPEYQGYTALRLPPVSKSLSSRFKESIEYNYATRDELEEWELTLKQMIYEFESGNRSPNEVADAFQMFENNYHPNPPYIFQRYLRTLKDKPWKECTCTICSELGIEVIIFRGNNRNRARGFHNVYTFNKLREKILEDPDFELDPKEKNPTGRRKGQARQSNVSNKDKQEPQEQIIAKIKEPVIRKRIGSKKKNEDIRDPIKVRKDRVKINRRDHIDSWFD